MGDKVFKVRHVPTGLFVASPRGSLGLDWLERKGKLTDHAKLNKQGKSYARRADAATMLSTIGERLVHAYNAEHGFNRHLDRTTYTWTVDEGYLDSNDREARKKVLEGKFEVVEYDIVEVARHGLGETYETKDFGSPYGDAVGHVATRARKLIRGDENNVEWGDGWP